MDEQRVATYAEVIWTTSQNDEGTVSATGANIVARAVIAVADREQEALRADAWDEGYRYGRILQAESMAEDAEDIGAPLQVRNWLKNSVLSLRRNLDGVRFRDNPYRAALSEQGPTGESAS